MINCNFWLRPRLGKLRFVGVFWQILFSPYIRFKAQHFKIVKQLIVFEIEHSAALHLHIYTKSYSFCKIFLIVAKVWNLNPLENTKSYCFFVLAQYWVINYWIKCFCGSTISALICYWQKAFAPWFNRCINIRKRSLLDVYWKIAV